METLEALEASSGFLHGGPARLDEKGGAPLKIGYLSNVYKGPGVGMVLGDEALPYTEQSFDRAQDMLGAYTAGQLDGMAVDNWPGTRYDPGAVFDMTMTHFAVKKGNEALLARLERAQDQLALARPTVISDILHQREDEGERPPLLLDREERVYLRTHGKLSVLVVANERPYAYLDENGELAGASIRIRSMSCSPSLPSRSSPSSRSGGIVRCGMKMKRTCRASSIMTMRRACTMRSGSNARERRSSRATAWGHRSVLSSSCASCGHQ